MTTQETEWDRSIQSLWAANISQTTVGGKCRLSALRLNQRHRMWSACATGSRIKYQLVDEYGVTTRRCVAQIARNNIDKKGN